MDITRFNKELAERIAKAKRFEKNNNIKSAIKMWLEVSELTISLSKSRNLNVSFKNMLINRTKQIFEHVKYLKSGQIRKEQYRESYPSQEERYQPQELPQYNYEIEEDTQGQDISGNENLDIETPNKTIKNSEFKLLPKGFKEIKTTEDFKIITPHDEDFVRKQLDKAFDSEYFAKRRQETENNSKSQGRMEFDQPEDNKNKICFACGYDKNSHKDKVCKNCGTNLD
ncbi:MAG: hypothetical protein ACFE9Z_06690 [Promethearchaeota archaeon]